MTFSVEIPDDVVREFKDYWRTKAKLRIDWEATLKGRVRQLVGWKILVPSKPELSTVCRGFNKPCTKMAELGSRYCSAHREALKRYQERKKAHATP